MDQYHGTTILSVRRGARVAMGGDGQVTLGNLVIKASARKVRRIHQGAILAGFAGGTADAFTLFERFEAKLDKHQGNLLRSAVELAKDWRSDRALRRLEAAAELGKLERERLDTSRSILDLTGDLQAAKRERDRTAGITKAPGLTKAPTAAAERVLSI